jgi:hypothetical protein
MQNETVDIDGSGLIESKTVANQSNQENQVVHTTCQTTR